MRKVVLAIAILFVGCADTTNKNLPPITEAVKVSDKVAPKAPKGAIFAEFMENSDSIYAFIKEVDIKNQKTSIEFQNNTLPSIVISESIGAHIQALKLKNFKTEVLLVNAKLKDTNFNEYYLFYWNGTAWTQPVNRFNIHKSNMHDSLAPIWNNPNDSTQLIRYYSVFDIDRESDQKYNWKLLKESIPIKEQ